jgi:molecular chaperone GrpE
MPEPTGDGEPEVQGPDAIAPEAPDPVAELERTRESYLRLAADFENFKRRRAQEAQEQARYGAAGLLRAILPVLDNLERALSHIPEDAADGLAEGLRLTVRQLEEALRSEGVARIPAVGEPFDPRLHEAVTTVPGQPAGQVVSEYLPGYRLHDRVVRAAQVAVGGGETADGGQEPSGEPARAVGPGDELVEAESG